jgi:hypothetical protein
MSFWSLFNPVEAVKSLIELARKPIDGWQERKTLKAVTQAEVDKLEAQAIVEKAKASVELAKTGQIIESDWDKRAQEQMTRSWKDEVLMLLLFLPVAVMFMAAIFGNDALIDRMIKVVKALEEFPVWYVVILLGIVASVFALRWLVAPLVAGRFGKAVKGKLNGKSSQNNN